MFGVTTAQEEILRALASGAALVQTTEIVRGKPSGYRWSGPGPVHNPELADVRALVRAKLARVTCGPSPGMGTLAPIVVEITDAGRNLLEGGEE